MPKRKEPELDPKEQFKRFQEAAKEHGVDQAQEAVEAAFKRLTPRSKAQENPVPKNLRRR